MSRNMYVEEGYGNRKKYLQGLADDFGIPESVVFGLARILGPNEDFDGLVIELEDYSGVYVEDL